VTSLGDIFRRYGPQYREKFGQHMLPSHRAVMTAIEACRTEVLGGDVYVCPACGTLPYSYHSSQNRHCRTCQHDAAQAWLDRQPHLLLPVPYFMVTFTLPAELREVARSQQQPIYSLLFRASAAALQQLAQHERFIGGQIGFLGVLQTWTRDLRYHPQVHYLVPAVGLTPDGRWVLPKTEFLVHVKPLAALFRAKVRAAMRQLHLDAQVPREVWRKEWVVDCRAVGSGRSALKYLAPYIFRVALSNNRIVKVADDQVTFRYTVSDSGQTGYCTLPVQEFIRRFLQHVLPKGRVSVRYYGLFSPRQRGRLSQVRGLLALAGLAAAASPAGSTVASVPSQPVLRCPNCGELICAVESIPPRSRSPPAPVGY
jgi:hypothetical protein